MSEHTFGIFGIKIELSQQGMKKVSYVIKSIIFLRICLMIFGLTFLKFINQYMS